MKARAQGARLFVCVLLTGIVPWAYGCGSERSEAPAQDAARLGVSPAGASRSSEPRVVLGRLGDEGLRPPGFANPRRVRIDRQSRPGVCKPVPFAFEVTPPAGSERLSLAFSRRSGGAKRKPPQPSRASTLRLERNQLTLFERMLTRANHWHSATIDLGLALPESDEQAPIRIDVRGEPGEGEFCVASLDFLGGRARLDQSPHVLLISLDTLGAPYLGSHGGLPGISPRIDRFLAESFEFRRAIAQFGHTLVSHSSLFASQYPRVHGRYETRWERGLPPLDSLVETIAAAGYRTVAFTEDAYVSSEFGFDRGFDVYHDGEEAVEPGRGRAAQTFADAERFLREQAKELRLFLFLHTYEVHSPYVPKTPAGMKLANRLTPGDSRVFNNEQTHDAFARHLRGEALLGKREERRLRALHQAELFELDGVFGALLDTLSALGLERDVLLVVTSDHGEVFGENGAYSHGITLHNRILNVPLAFRWPGRIAAGSSETPVQLIDALVTVLDLIGLTPSKPASGRQRSGRSLVPRMTGGTQGGDTGIAISEELRRRPCRPGDTDSACWVEHYAVQSRRFKLVRSRDGRYERFYDLERDPNEIANAIGTDEDEVRQALEKHRAALDRYLEATPDVLHARRDAEAQERDEQGGTAGEVDAETRARLEALGYVF